MNQELAKTTYAFFNISLALFFIVIGSPVFLFLAILVFVADGWPIFYRGARMGQHKQTYYMFKFRTLVVNAESKIGARVLSEKMAVNDNLEHRFGRFLRNSRLDELPQLFNIVLGEMNFVGPRPVRQLVYQRVSREIPGFDRRFLVKPGLLGVAQVFTPHSTPKRLRAKIDYVFVAQKDINYVRELRLIALVIYATLRQTLIELVERGRLFLRDRHIISGWQEKRKFVRRSYPNPPIKLTLPDGQAILGSFADINIEHVATQVPIPLVPDVTYPVRLHLKVRHKSMTKFADLRVSIVTTRVSKDPRYPYAYVMHYEAVSELNEYRIAQYFLRGSFF